MISGRRQKKNANNYEKQQHYNELFCVVSLLELFCNSKQ